MQLIAATRKRRGVYKRSKLVHGIGVNDADYPVVINATIAGKTKTLWFCPYYNTWSGILERCYSAKFQTKNRAYAGCSVVPAWHRFSVFRAWMAEQHWEGNQLDKDLLVQGNRVYSPATCLFVHKLVNTFILDNASTRGAHPAGVCWSEEKRKFSAQCNNPFTGKRGHIGYFLRADDAHLAWAIRKLEHAETLASKQTDHRVADALISRFTAKYDEAVAALTHTR